MAQETREVVDLYPTLLRVPGEPGRMPRELVLPLWPAAYVVRQSGPDEWIVMQGYSGHVLYRGAGPVEFLESPAPF